MKALFSELRLAIAATLVLAAVTCGAYPLLITAIAQTAFKDKANGSLITDKDGILRGSALLGQSFAGEKYFHARPSAAGLGYDATSSGGTNLGPTSKKLNDAISQCIADYRKQNGLDDQSAVPADAVTASGSGLDPHISLKNAEIQSTRVARARAMSREKIQELIDASTDKADLGVLVESGVNVLRLNLALDTLK